MLQVQLGQENVFSVSSSAQIMDALTLPSCVTAFVIVTMDQMKLDVVCVLSQDN